MTARETKPRLHRPAIGVLLVGVLIAACGSNAAHSAPATSSPGSTSVASTSASAATGVSGSAAASTSAPASSGSASAAPSTSSAASTGTTTGGPSAIASPVGLEPGQVGTRAQVPWSQVGPGWFLVTSDSSAVPSEQASASPARTGGTATLSLVSPTGARYVITSWPGVGASSSPSPENLASLVGWSGNGQDAVLSNPGGVAVVVDLSTGVRHEFSVPYLSAIGFTSPMGANLVASEDISAADGTWLGQSLVRLDLNGKLQATLVTAAHTSLQWLYSADGATLYLNGQGGLRQVGNGGGAIRDLATFATPDAECSPVSWWDPHTILASCNVNAGFRLWLVPAAGGSATPLTAAPGSGPVGLGYDNAVRAGDAIFAQHLEGCGVVTIHRLAPNGVGNHVAIPGSLSNDRLIGAVGTKIAVVSSTECGSPSWFGFYDPATNTTQKIIPDVPGEVGALAAVAFP